MLTPLCNLNWKVPDDWKGLRIKDDKPLSPSHLQKIIKEIVADSPLHYRYAERIVREATELLKKDEALNYVKIPTKGEITIVGDLSGQFIDLKKILRLCEFFIVPDLFSQASLR